MPKRATQSQPTPAAPAAELAPGALVTVESQREFDLLSGRRLERTFLKLYVEARTTGLLAAISDRDWKTLCTLATYMDSDGYCFPSQAELARAMGCSRQMANARIKSLANFRFQGKPVLLVEREGRTEQGTWTRNGYHVLPIANLSIFADDDQGTPGDKRKLNRPAWMTPASPAPGAAVSRTVDTAQDSTVSSPTVPVQLDTNKNQRTNQKRSDSNIRTAHTKKAGNVLNHLGAPQPEQGSLETIGAALQQRHLPQPRNRTLVGDPDRDVILEYMIDWSRELGDQAPLKSSTTRAYNLYRRSELPLETFIEGLYRARAIVKERSASIRSTPSDNATGARRNKMAYFFAVLEDLLGMRDDEDEVGTTSSR